MSNSSRPETPENRPESPIDRLTRHTRNVARTAADRVRRDLTEAARVVRVQSPRLVHRAVETVRNEARAVSGTNLGVACR